MIIGWHEWLNLKIDKDGGGRRAGRSRSASASSTGSNEGDVRAAKILRIDLSRRWMEAAMEVLQYFTDRTPGAWIDVGESTVRWHWSDADETFGGTQAQVCLSTTKSVFSSLVLFFHLSLSLSCSRVLSRALPLASSRARPLPLSLLLACLSSLYAPPPPPLSQKSAAKILQAILPTEVVQITLEQSYRYLLVRPTVLTKKRMLSRIMDVTKPASGEFDVVLFIGQDEDTTALVNRYPG